MFLRSNPITCLAGSFYFSVGRMGGGKSSDRASEAHKKGNKAHKKIVGDAGEGLVGSEVSLGDGIYDGGCGLSPSAGVLPSGLAYWKKDIGGSVIKRLKKTILFGAANAEKCIFVRRLLSMGFPVCPCCVALRRFGLPSRATAEDGEKSE